MSFLKKSVNNFEVAYKATNREFSCFGLVSILEVWQKSLQHDLDSNSLCSNQSGEWLRKFSVTSKMAANPKHGNSLF